MIKAQELRIGNWVDYKYKYYQIYDGIRSLSIDDLDSESLDSHLKNIKLLDLHPIPITEEILLKCGFQKYAPSIFNEDRYVLGFISLIVTTSKDILFNGILIKYLHQLQNLYFTIMGEELNIEL